MIYFTYLLLQHQYVNITEYPYVILFQYYQQKTHFVAINSIMSLCLAYCNTEINLRTMKVCFQIYIIVKPSSITGIVKIFTREWEWFFKNINELQRLHHIEIGQISFFSEYFREIIPNQCNNLVTLRVCNSPNIALHFNA